MYDLHRSNRFRKSYKKINGSGSFISEDFEHLVSLIAGGQTLPDHYHDHALKGNYIGLRECHIKGDLLLIYEVDDKYELIYLIDIGNHSNLFG
jgi:mRNA interferase YafQ